MLCIQSIEPVDGDRHRPGVQKAIFATIATSPGARPSPVFSAAYQPAAQGILFDVTTSDQQMHFGFNCDRFESTLINGAGSCRAVTRVPALCVSHGQPVHEPGELVGLAGPNNQMPMVRHCTICEQTHAKTLDGLHENGFERDVVRGILEQQCAPNSSIEYVIREIAGRTARTSWHRVAYLQRKLNA